MGFIEGLVFYTLIILFRGPIWIVIYFFKSIYWIVTTTWTISYNCIDYTSDKCEDFYYFIKSHKKDKEDKKNKTIKVIKKSK